MARSGDYSRVLAAANDATGAVAVFDSGGSLLAGPQALGSGIISFVAANADGSRFAVAFTASGGPQVLLLDSGPLNVLGSYPSSGTVGLAFSREWANAVRFGAAGKFQRDHRAFYNDTDGFLPCAHAILRKFADRN